MTKEDKTLANYHFENLKKQRKYFDYADTSQFLLEQKKDEDLLILQGTFVEWINKLKKEDARKKEFTLLLQSIWRIESYCRNLETVCKSSVCNLGETEKKIERLESDKRILEFEIIQIKSKYEAEKNSLEKQIEFISKNG
jgi:hypothetical protein